MASIKLIVGLGNPGLEYEKTRHNVGAWFIDFYAKQQQEKLRRENKLHSFITRINQNGYTFTLAMPTTYMNESGLSLSALLHFYKMTPEEVLVVHDELDFPAGKVQLKQSGGHGGHNGLRDITQHLGTRDFWRLRIGIGHPGHKDKVTPYVLGRPSSHDKMLIDNAITDASHIVPDLITGDFETAMRYLHNED